jgi:phage terminase large subunit GpA-like protein
MKRTKFVSSEKLPDRTDDIKEASSRRGGHHAAAREDHIRYYNLWHCPRCDEEVERVCREHGWLYGIESNDFLEDAEHIECQLDKVCLKCNVFFDWDMTKELPKIVLDNAPEIGIINPR